MTVLTLCAQLWRQLYLSRFARRQSQTLRQLANRNWLQLYKTSTNWRRGAARRVLLGDAPVSTQTSVRESVLPRPPRAPRIRRAPEPPDTVLAFHGHLYFTASRTDPLPIVTIRESLPGGGSQIRGTVRSHTLELYWSRRRANTTAPSFHITELQLDTKLQLAPSRALRLVIFYSTGQLALFDVDAQTLVARETATARLGEARDGRVAEHVALARLSSPLLVALTSDCALKMWRIRKAGCAELEPDVELVELELSFRAHSIGSPAMLCLTPQGTAYCVTLVYATAILLGGSISIQQFLIGLDGRVAQRHTSIRAYHDSWTTSIEFAAPFIVASRADNTIDVFRLQEGEHDERQDVRDERQDVRDDRRAMRDDFWRFEVSPLRLSHVRTLFGHTGGVRSVALCSDRCVSGGVDGVKVWELAQGQHVDVGEHPRALANVKKLFFDEHKIVSIVSDSTPAAKEHVKLLRFD